MQVLVVGLESSGEGVGISPPLPPALLSSGKLHVMARVGSAL